MTLTTLADMRELVEKHLAAECREADAHQYSGQSSSLTLTILIQFAPLPTVRWPHS